MSVSFARRTNTADVSSPCPKSWRRRQCCCQWEGAGKMLIFERIAQNRFLPLAASFRTRSLHAVIVRRVCHARVQMSNASWLAACVWLAVSLRERPPSFHRTPDLLSAHYKKVAQNFLSFLFFLERREIAQLIHART